MVVWFDFYEFGIVVVECVLWFELNLCLVVCFVVVELFFDFGECVIIVVV